jgi:hypothetical protein
MLSGIVNQFCALQNDFHRRVDGLEFGSVCAGTGDQDNVPAERDGCQSMLHRLAQQAFGAIAPDGVADFLPGDETKAASFLAVRGGAQDDQWMRPRLAAVPHALEIIAAETVGALHTISVLDLSG